MYECTDDTRISNNSKKREEGGKQKVKLKVHLQSVHLVVHSVRQGMSWSPHCLFTHLCDVM